MAAIERRHWRCPACNRTFNIPVDVDPNLCPECALAVTQQPKLSPRVQPIPPVQTTAIVIPPAEPSMSQIPVFEREPMQLRKLKRNRSNSRGFVVAIGIIGVVGVAGVAAKLMIEDRETGIAGLALAAAFAMAFIVYLLPTWIAVSRNHHNALAIAALNIALGWTFLGYVAAIVWALTAVRRFDEHGNTYVRRWDG